ncbi:MAG: YicC family protein [Betaproteobacteria bacterium]|nr:YicC family protein [Betaproteobacteria bacterium]
MPTIHSMTGYASLSADVADGHLSLELRAVNNRFLEINFRMGEDLRVLEGALRERISAQVGRGKLECRINFLARSGANLPTTLDTSMLERLLQLAASAQRLAPDAKPLGLGELLRWPGVMGETAIDNEALQGAILGRMDALLADFNASRAREGEKLTALLLERLQAIRAQAMQLRPRVPEIVAMYRDKLQKRLVELAPDLAPERIVQEVALFAQRIDVDEELDRLLAHLAEVEHTLKKGGPAGKRLDFLMQELNREANTLGSKAGALDISHAAVDLKVLIEQMREQIQNIE